MCVICCSENGSRPPDSDLAKMADHNSDGIGIGWRNSTTSKIHFQRGVKLGQAISLLNTINTNKWAYILHFRIATVGGVHRRLTHPFPVTTDQRLLFAKSGEVDYVLAHNGHWGLWESDVHVPAFKHRQGPWSDSAALAYVAAKAKTIWIPSGNRVCTLHSKDGLEILETKSSGTWTHKDGYHLSNTYWDRTYSYTRSTSGYTASPHGWGGYGGWEGYYDPTDECSIEARHQASRQGNKYACKHGNYIACGSCLPTHNGLPIEVLPNASCSYTYSNNGVLKGVPDPGHSCQHTGKNVHWHCDECTKSCAKIRAELTLAQYDKIREQNKSLIARTNGKVTTIANGKIYTPPPTTTAIPP